ncbi:hypothetical protein LC612_40465 [Nostoc sp. CHAB 5834]|nr:hypothetical protein [Nostoc sp. CHAB 5834]
MSDTTNPNGQALVIYCAAEAAFSDKSAGFWNNEYGWTTLDKATLFSPDEARALSLPIGAGVVKWENRARFSSVKQQNVECPVAPEVLPTLEVTLKATYNLNGVSLRDLKGDLRARLYSAIGNGLLSGHSEAEVETYHLEVREVAS